MADPQHRIRVAIVENNLIIGGVQRLVLEQLTALNPDTFQVMLITLTQPDREDFYDQVPEYVEVVRLSFSSILDIRNWFVLANMLRTYDPAVVKTTTYFSNTIVQLIRLFSGSYAVITAEHNTKKVKNYYQRLVSRFLSRFSTTIIVDSTMVAEYVSKTDGIARSQFTVVYNGADISSIESRKRELGPKRETLRAEYGIDEQDVLFVNIARMVAQKNHIRLIEAFARTHKKNPHTKLLIVGDGSRRPEIEACITKHALQKAVLLVGMQSHIATFYVMSDYTVVSSDHEGFCIAAIEGMAYGAPLISTPVGGVSEYLVPDTNGFLSTFSVESYAEQLDRAVALFEREGYAAMSEQAMQTAGLYSTDAYHEKFRGLVTQAANDTPIS